MRTSHLRKKSSLPDRLRRRQLRWAALAVGGGVALTAVTGCSATTSAAPLVSPIGTAASSAAGVTFTRVRLNPVPEHVHGLVVISGGVLLAATHEGLLRVGQDGTTRRIGAGRDDLMGLTRTANGHLLASGHPGPGSTRRDPLGIITSTDAGLTWRSTTVDANADFHALSTRGASITGWDGAIVRSSSDSGRTWREGAAGEVWSLSQDSSSVWATGPKGLSRSTDHGQTFQPAPGAPSLALATTGADATPWGVDTAGVVWVWSGAESRWAHVTGVRPAQSISAIAAADASTAYLIVDDDLVRVERTTPAPEESRSGADLRSAPSKLHVRI